MFYINSSNSNSNSNSNNSSNSNSNSIYEIYIGECTCYRSLTTVFSLPRFIHYYRTKKHVLRLFMFVTTPKYKNSTALLITTTIHHTYLDIVLQKEGPSTISMKLHWGMYYLRITFITERRRILSVILCS